MIYFLSIWGASPSLSIVDSCGLSIMAYATEELYPQSERDVIVEMNQRGIEWGMR